MIVYNILVSLFIIQYISSNLQVRCRFSIKQISNLVLFHFVRTEVIALVAAFVSTHMRRVATTRNFNNINWFGYIPIISDWKYLQPLYSSLNVILNNLFQPLFSVCIPIYDKAWALCSCSSIPYRIIPPSELANADTSFAISAFFLSSLLNAPPRRLEI